MLDEIITEVMPLLVQIVATVIVILFARWAKPALESYVGAERLATIAHLAREAYAFVEAQAPALAIKGQEKLAMAIEYLNDRLAERKIPITIDQMRGAIEDAWLEYNAPVEPPVQ